MRAKIKKPTRGAMKQLPEQSTPVEPQIDGREYLRLIGIAALVGIPAALVAVGFLQSVHLIEGWLWHDLPLHLGLSSPPWYLVVGLPIVGAALVLAARRLLPGDGGHSPMEGISLAPTPLSHAPGVIVAALGSLAFGAVIGPEAPLIALGAFVGLALTKIIRVSEPGQRVLATAGSFSAISALFGGPIVAGMLIVEAGIGMGSALLPVLVPGLVAAAIGYLVFVGLGPYDGLPTTPLSVSGLPTYNSTRVVDLLLAIAVGLAAGVLVIAVKRLASGLPPLQVRVGLPVVLLGGGLAIGLIAQLASVWGANVNDVLFSGQTSIPALISSTGVGAVVLLLVAKSLAYGISLGAGFRGGPVFPAIFLGIGLAMIAVITLGGSTTMAVAVGTAAGMAAATRLLLASLIFAALLVGPAGADTIPAAVLAAASAWLVASAWERRIQSIPSDSARR